MDTTSALAPGLDRPVYDSIIVFRAVADAMAHPGRITPLPVRPPAPSRLMPAAAGLCLALLDFETPLWVQQPHSDVTEYLRFHCGCPLVAEPGRAAFALVNDMSSMPPLAAFNAGTAEYPDRSATLWVQVTDLVDVGGVQLSGPGLQRPAALEVAGVSAAQWHEIQTSRAAFPRGVDIVFVAGDRIAALPRTTKVTC